MNRIVKFRTVVCAVADIEMEVTPTPDGGSFIQAKLAKDDLMISVSANFKDADDLTQQVRDYLTYSAGHTITEATFERMTKKLQAKGEEQMPTFSNGGTVGEA